MQSDEENFEESLETHSPVRKTEDPEDRYSLRRTPARSQSEKLLEAKMDQQKLLEDLCIGSAATAQNPNAIGFAFWRNVFIICRTIFNFEKLHAERKGG